MKFYAHSKEGVPPENWQELEEHLQNVASLSEKFAGKIGLSALGKQAGILHDLGKFGKDFQDYIRAVGQPPEQDEDFPNQAMERGKIDHSTAGAQYIWKMNIPQNGENPAVVSLTKQILALSIASHHSGLIDCLSPVGEPVFKNRMDKDQSVTHIDESLENAKTTVIKQYLDNIDIKTALSELGKYIRDMSLSVRDILFPLGMTARFVLSALIDADRLDAAGRMKNESTHFDWSCVIDRLEKHLAGMKQRNDLDRIRTEISSQCKTHAYRENGLYKLTVPTGGGKTLASLRFALHHAKERKMERIIYVIPYTSIIDQNASVASSIFETDDDRGQIVLEHHSNLTPQKEAYQNKELAENWDAPIIYTTAVQFLETLFSSGTRSLRRMHNLANSVIIFDEIQSLPVKTVHIFNNAVNFLVKQCASTVLFCTATQPLLDRVDDQKGAAKLSPDPEIMKDLNGLFKSLNRVDIFDRRKTGGWTEKDVAQLAGEEVNETGSVLIIVNTKAAAKNIYKCCRDNVKDAEIFHLSTNMCPAHRMDILEKVKSCLDLKNPKNVICVSTQLIEAGIDIDFASVIRSLAGLDSIAQAAGRCNRNNLRGRQGRVFIINLQNENISLLTDIVEGRENTMRILDDFKNDPASFNNDLLGPDAMNRYYTNYFFNRAEDMSYTLGREQLGRDGDILSLLSSDPAAENAYARNFNERPPFLLRQSFRSAGEAFKLIDAPTEGIIVPYGDGKKIIGELCSVFDIKARPDLLKKAQRYSVNVFPNTLQCLMGSQSIYEVQKGSGIMYLQESAYNDKFGISPELQGECSFCNA